MLRLSSFDWSDFVEKGFFLTAVSGAVATGFALTQGDSFPAWMVRSTPLLFLSLALAFTRVWKTAREERETKELWKKFGEAVPPSGAGMQQMKDAVFEIPYLFSIAFLPVSVVSLQTFAVCLLVFYISDNYYNLQLVRGVSGHDGDIRPLSWLRWLHGLGVALDHRVRGTPHALLAVLGAAFESVSSTVVPQANSIDRLVLVRFFGRRVGLDIIAIWLVFAVLSLVVFGSRDRATTAGVLVVATLLVMELVVEPLRGFGVQFKPADEDLAISGSPANDRYSLPAERFLWAVPHGVRLDKKTRDTVTSLHEGAFDQPERQITAQQMLAGGADKCLMLLTEDHDVVGYVFMEGRPRHQVVFFWYLAIQTERRGHKLGNLMVSQALDYVRERWPNCRAVFLETTQPKFPDDESSTDRRRVDFYQRLGFFWVQGLNYEIPLAKPEADEPAPKGPTTDKKKRLVYDPMFYNLRERNELLPDAFVRRAVLEMARDNFVEQPGDPRWTALKKSVKDLRVVDPPPADAT